MKKLLVPLAVLVVLAMMFGCADDIYLEADAPLDGVYRGTYTVITDYGSVSADTAMNYVVWRFTETNYFMKIDTAQHTGMCFCRVDGRYSLTDGVRLVEMNSRVDDRPPDCQACNEAYNPQGTFQRQARGNELILRTIDNATSTFVELKLTRTDEEWEDI